jgi:integrase
LTATATKETNKETDHSSNYDSAITAYIRNIRTMSNSTADEYLSRLNNFENFMAKEYDSCLTINDLIAKIKNALLDPYDIINRYAAYLRNCNITASTLKQRVVTVKNFLEYCDVDISPRKFKLKVKLPKVVRKRKEALSKEDIIEILNICDNIRLRTYVMLLAATGMRAVEALSIRIRDLDFDSNPANVFVRGEYTKTKFDRIVFISTKHPFFADIK